MQVLDPVPIEKVPIKGRIFVSPEVDAIDKRVLALEGEALPVQFESVAKAKSFASRFQEGRAGRRIGLSARRAGNVVFVFKKGALKGA